MQPRIINRSGSNTADIHETALRMLARRALSRAELVERLDRKGFSLGAARQEAARLEQAGLLDERELAGALCRESLRTGHGRRAASATLYRRRIAAEVRGEALDEVDEADESAALEVSLARASQRYSAWRRLPGERRKVIRYLLARGFAASQVRRALHDLGRGESESPEATDAGDPPDLP